jgi:hypothetical protein
MRIAIDTHVHLYPFHDVSRVLEVAHRNLSRIAPGADRLVICLTERAGSNRYEALARGELAPRGWKIAATPERALLLATARDGRTVDVLAGRQIIAAERIEVLALGADLWLDDGLPAQEVIARIRDAGAVPVLPWGLGKWWGVRGGVVKNLIAAFRPGDLALGDTYLLPALALRPALLRWGQAHGYRVLAGTDPLAKPGEEDLVGRYGVLADVSMEGELSAQSLIRLLGDPAIPLQTIGRRGSLADTLRRAR